MLFELRFQNREAGAPLSWLVRITVVTHGTDRVKGIAARDISTATPALAVGHQTPDTAGVTANVEAAHSQTAGNIAAHIVGAYPSAANIQRTGIRATRVDAACLSTAGNGGTTNAALMNAARVAEDTYRSRTGAVANTYRSGTDKTVASLTMYGSAGRRGSALRLHVNHQIFNLEGLHR